MTKVPPFMGDFSDDDIAWAIRVGVRRHVRAGERIILEGEHPRELFIILEGAFVVESRQLNRPNMKRLGPGELVGEMSYINRQVPVSSVRALEDSELLCIPRTALDEKIAGDPGFAGRFHKVVSEFAVARLYAWSPPPTEPPPERASGDERVEWMPKPAEGSLRVDEPIQRAEVPVDESFRVYELIERMLRGEFIDSSPSPARPREAGKSEPPGPPEKKRTDRRQGREKSKDEPPREPDKDQDEPPGSK